MEQPNLKIEGKTYWQIGCRNCQKGDRYKVFFDGESNYVTQCECGKIAKIEPKNMVDKPDTKPIELRHIL